METLQLKQFSDMRSQRAEAILQRGNPESIDEYTYLVPSQTSDKKYRVTHLDSYSCECKDFEVRCRGQQLYCKHIKAILLFEKLKNSYDVEESPIKQEIEMMVQPSQKTSCPYCSCETIFKRGVRKTQLGEKQLYCCKDCKRRFVVEPIRNIKGNAKLVCLAMDCYYKGLSFRDISDQFKQFYGLSISHVAIRSWVLKFSTIMEKYAKDLKPQTSGRWNADETLVLTKRGIDKENHNAEFDYLWNVMDYKTKFLLASVNSGRARGIPEVKAVMQEAYKQNGVMPKEIITDKLASYQEGIRKTFRNWGNQNKVKHISILGRRNQINNNAIEGHHSLQKEFQKVRRGISEVQNYADGYKVYHNFIRKGIDDQKTPAERSGIETKGQNRWYPLLLNAVKATHLTSEEKTKESH